jgi:hypothetical protein
MTEEYKVDIFNNFNSRCITTKKKLNAQLIGENCGFEVSNFG